MGVPAPSSPSGSRKSSQQAVSPADAASIPNAAIAPMPEPKRISAIARIATRGGPAGYSWGVAEIAARHGYLYGWYAALACAAELDADVLQRAASAIEARSDATGTGAAEGESAAPKGGDAQ